MAFNDSDGNSFLNFTGKIFKDLKKVLLTFEVKVKSDQSATYDKVKLRSHVDTCKKINFGNYILKFIMMNLDKYSNIKIEQCPITAGHYYAHNFPAPSVSMTLIPAFLNSKSTQWKLTFVLKAKTSKTEPVANVIVVNIRGQTCQE